MMRPNAGLWECPHGLANSFVQGWLRLGAWATIFARDFASGWGPTRAYHLWPGPWGIADLPAKCWKEEARPDVQRMAEPLSSFTSLGPSSSISGLRCRKPSCSTDVLKRCLDIARLYTAMYARTPYRSTCQGLVAQRAVFLQNASQKGKNRLRLLHATARLP